MTRRTFISGMGCTLAVALLPREVRAQAPERMPRVAVLMLYGESDPEGQLRVEAFRQGLQQAGWSPGRNVVVNYLWGVFDKEWTRAAIAQLQAWSPDVIVVNTSTGLRAIQSATTKPIIFVGVSEPVAQGFVASLARPGGSVTGFSNLEPTLGAKWFDLLREIAPDIRRIAFLYNSGNPGSKVALESAQTAANKFSVQLTDAPVSTLPEIETAIATLGREPGGALIIPPDPFVITFRKRIVELATASRIPIVSATRSVVDEGGLLAYGANIPNLFRLAAGYVDRILRGQKPADMPVQQPTTFEMVINLKSAKALGLTVPPMLLARADEVIE
jgi:putative tryptophan/tyrosine transport system substrate-binding protein